MFRLPIVSLNKSILWSQDAALRQKSRLIDIESDEELTFVQSLIREMLITLSTDPSGVALAAPQVGILLQVIVINYEDRDINEQRILALINPKITFTSPETTEDQEICLSTPNFAGKVARSNKVEVETYTPQGTITKFQAEGFFARVVQHEIDHLNGILCIDRANKAKVNYIQEFPERRIDLTMKALGLARKKQ